MKVSKAWHFIFSPSRRGSPFPFILAKRQNSHTCTHYYATWIHAFCMSNVLG